MRTAAPLRFAAYLAVARFARGLPAFLIPLALCASGCNDGGGITTPGEQRSGVAPAVASVTAPITALAHPQTIIGSVASLRGTTCILPVHAYSSFDVGQKPSEFVEGAIFAGLISPDGVTGTVRLIAASAAATNPNSNVLYWPEAGQTMGPVRGLAIDILEYDAAGKVPAYQDFEGLLKGRLWVAAGTSLHVLAGRDGAGAMRGTVQLAQIDAAAQLPPGETLQALCAAPPNLVLFAASQTRVLRITPAPDATLSTVEVFADIPGTDGQAIHALAADGNGRLYAARRAPGAFSLRRFEVASLAAVPATPLDFPLSGATLSTPTAISVNSANHLVVGERATSRLLEFDDAGALVVEMPILTTTALLPSFPTPATATAFDVTAPLPNDQLVAFFCDVYISRIVLATAPSPTTGGVRLLANPSFRGGVVPILQNRCIFCHSTATPLAGLDLFGPPEMVRARLLGRACETFAIDDPDRPAECQGLPVQNPFLIPTATSDPRVFPQPGVTCPNCPFPEPLTRVEPFAPTASYVVRKLLVSKQAPLLIFPPDINEPAFTNNCADDFTTPLEAGEVCGERMPLASFLQRPIRRAEIEMIEKWIRRGAPDD